MRSPATDANLFSFGIQVVAGERIWVTYCGDDGSGFAKVLCVDEALSTETFAPLTLWSDGTILPSMAYPVRIDDDVTTVVIGAQTAYGNCVMATNVTFSAHDNTDPSWRRTYWAALASKPFIRAAAD